MGIGVNRSWGNFVQNFYLLGDVAGGDGFGHQVSGIRQTLPDVSNSKSRNEKVVKININGAVEK